ncbi:MAG TPA: hypothetical protein VFP63_02825 [Dehalococcoidia bacterium]|nr:hypothetical protein [Dehalococcoidia bacterium]
MAGFPGQDRHTDTASVAVGTHSSIARALPGHLPRTVPPMLASSAAEPFDSNSHVFEVLWDGVRALLFAERGQVRVQDRYGRDVTARYPELQAAGPHLMGSGAVLDGVIVSPDDEGRPDFARLLRRLSAADYVEAALLAAKAPVSFQAFDILYRGGASVMSEPLRTRKTLLQQAVRDQRVITVPDVVEREGVAFFEAARAHSLPGIVAKDGDSKYVPGERSRDWLAMRVFERGKFVIGGCTYGRALRPGRPARARGPFDSLLLGQYDSAGALRLAGAVEGPFDRDVAADLARSMDLLADSTSPFVDEPAAARLIFWTRPDMVASVRFAGRSPAGLRFAIFECLRPDVPPSACRLPED